jgi:3-hydroxybutyryl-CoA dehydratase
VFVQVHFIDGDGGSDGVSEVDGALELKGLRDVYASGAGELGAEERIAHGLLSASFFSSLFGTKLPGPGCVYVSQSLQFKRPVYLGDTVTATVTVNKVDLNKHRIFFDTTCSVKNRTVISGEAEIYLPKNK